jgi:hypothetical protein
VRVGRRISRNPRNDGGFVTAELALALPSLVLILAIGLWLQGAVALQARCLDAARAGARAAARGDPDATVRARLANVVPTGADIVIARDGGRITVTVDSRVEAPGGLSAFVGRPRVTATAVALDEAETS